MLSGLTLLDSIIVSAFVYSFSSAADMKMKPLSAIEQPFSRATLYTVNVVMQGAGCEVGCWNLVPNNAKAASLVTALGVQHKVDLRFVLNAKLKVRNLAQHLCSSFGAAGLKLYFHIKANTMVESSSVRPDSIPTTAFATSNHSMASMPKGFVRDKASSMAGLLLTLKPTDQVTAILILASSYKDKHLLLADSPIRYSTRRKSMPGPTMGAKRKANACSASVAAIFMA